MSEAKKGGFTVKFRMSLLIIIALFVSMLAGCNESSSGSESKQVTLLIPNSTTKKGVEAIANIVEEKYGIKTVFESSPSGAEGDNLVKTRLATGDMSDLLLYNSGSLLQALNPKKNFVDISKEPFAENIMDSYKDVVSVDGAVYGIPSSSVGVGGWLYNKRVYKELGLSIPKTWDELMNNNEKIKAAGLTAVIGTYKDTSTSQMIFLEDNYNVIAEEPDFPELYTANKAKVADTPAALRGFEKLQEVYEKGFLNKDFLSTKYEAGVKMLAEGTGVHYPQLSGLIYTVAENHPEAIDDIGVFPQPSDNSEVNGFTVWMPPAIYANKNGKNVELAKKWMEVFVSQEGVDAYMSAVSIDGPLAVKDVELPDDVYPMVNDILPYFEEGKTTPALEFLSPIKGPNLEQITTEVGSGIKSALEGAKAYDKDVAKQAKQLGIEGW